MNYEYKFLRFKSREIKPEGIQGELNKLGTEGWKVLNFHPTSDIGLMGFLGTQNAWDLGYVFLLIREIP